MKLTNCHTNFKANKMSTMQARYVDKTLKNAQNVDIICHDMTDRDSANSALAMWEYLNNLGINSRVIISQKNPQSLKLRTYDFNMVQALDDEKLQSISPDIIFCVDFGGKERVKPNVLNHIEKCPKVMGFDHHSETDVSRGSFMQLQRPILDDECILSRINFYSDMTAKSATSVIYRFFEALQGDIDSNQAYDLFSGLVDDCIKRNLIKCDGIKGTIEAQEALIKDEHAYDVYKKLKAKLTDEQIAQIAKNIDVLSSLNEKEQAFKDSLNDRLNFSNNGKIAYIKINPDDEEWKDLGGDNTITSRILNNFRQEVLKNNEDVQVAIAFYEAHGDYRMSAHSKKPILLDFFKYIEDNTIYGFTKNSGGHPTRAGAGLKTTNPQICEKWVNDIISCDGFFN